MMFDEKYKLHPIAAVINFVKGLKELILPFAIIILTNGFNFSSDRSIWISILPSIIMLIIMLLYLIAGILKWWTFVYWFEDNELRVEYGLFVKKKRYIPFERIQSFNHKEGIFHRIFGLVQVMVETAGGNNGKPEVVLTAITKDAANQIEAVTKKAKETFVENSEDEQTTVIETPSKIIHKMTPKDLVILATTSNSMGVVLAGVVAILSQASEFIPYEKIYEELSSFVKFGVVVVSVSIIFAILVTWAISVVITFINYYGFTVTEEEDRLIITRGLLEKKRVTIPFNRIQAIKIVENPFRQLFGLAGVVFESASGGFGENDKKITVFPLISKKIMYSRLEELFPQFEWDVNLTKPPKRAKPFFYRLDFIWLIPVIGLCSYFFFPYGLLSILLIIPTILFGIWQYRTAGFSINDKQLTLVYRLINRVTFVVERKRIQAAEMSQSFFKKRKNIASVQVTVMSGISGATAKVENLNKEDADNIMSWFEK